MLKSMIIAFSTYSKIPMPRVEWEEKSMQYSMCFFPLIGVVIGAVFFAVFYLIEWLSFGNVAKGAFLAAVPLLVSGGIHMDGFLDTMDAKSSYRSKEEKLQILKDPHTGAFAIISGMLYLMLYYGLCSELSGSILYSVAVGFIYSRILSGLSVVTLKKAKPDGMLAATAKAAKKNVRWILWVQLVLCICILCYLNFGLGVLWIITGGICFFYYRHMAYQQFGGITGDLAGYFLQIFELLLLFTAVLAQRGGFLS